MVDGDRGAIKSSLLFPCNIQAWTSKTKRKSDLSAVLCTACLLDNVSAVLCTKGWKLEGDWSTYRGPETQQITAGSPRPAVLEWKSKGHDWLRGRWDRSIDRSIEENYRGDEQLKARGRSSRRSSCRYVLRCWRFKSPVLVSTVDATATVTGARPNLEFNNGTIGFLKL